jgi:amino acid adenylation domain-containing protein
MQDSLKNKLKNLSPDQIRKLLASRNKSLKTSASNTFEKMKRNPEEQYPLSKAQERIWFLSYLFKDSSLYNIPVAVKIYKDISLENLELALQQIVVNNAILRTTFHEENGRIHQQIHSKYKPSISYQDISGSADNNSLIEKIALSHSVKVFDLTELPLFTVKLIKIAKNEFILFLNLQHIISDGWTNALLSNDLHLDYSKLSTNSEKPYSYIDFVKWEQDWMESETYQEHIRFWRRELSALPTASRFPKDFYPTKESLQGKLLVYDFPNGTIQKITSFCQNNNYTPFQFYYVCFATLMSIYTQEKDIIIGTPVANRNSRYFQDTYGLFFNSLPIRLLIDIKLNFLQLMEKSISSINQFMKHQEVPFTEIIKTINPERNLDNNVLFNIHFAYQHFPKKNKEDKYEMLSIDYENSKFDVNFWVEVEGENSKLVVTYKKNRIASSKIEKFIKHYQSLIDAVIENPEESIYKQKIFPKKDLSIVSGPVIDHSEESWLELFNKALEEFPNHTAVIDSDEKITYTELNNRANALSQLFREKGVRENNVVILETGRNVSFIIGMLACFKNACAYLPIASNTPEEKLRFIIKDSNASLLVSDKKIDTIICVSPNELACYSFKEHQEAISLKKNDTAYIIYTSGTTTKPKGVLVSHGALLNYTKGLKNEINNISLQTFAHVSAIQADLGNTAIFLSLGYGGTLLFPSQEVLLDPILMSAFFRQNPADVLKIVPSHLEAFSEIIKEILPSKVLICGGEVLSNSLVSLIQENKSKELIVINHYGPTETTVGVLIHKLDLNNLEDRIPIGKPINNTKVYLLDEILNPVPNGVEGEICISGSNLANGYLNDPKLTGKKHISVDGEKIYRTGDRGIINEKGNVIFLGRNDSQIKINGFRIELNEIESVLKNHPDVENACVYLLEETSHIKKIGAAIQTSKDIQPNTLASYVKKYLSVIFVPTFYFVEKIPLTSNGKIDYNSLKERGTLNEKEDIEILPRDLFEIKILEFYKALLPNISISIEDNFFNIGGHSLLAIKLISKINKEFKSQLAIPNLFNHSSVKGLAGLLRKDTAKLTIIENPIALIEKKHLQKSIWIHPAGGNVMCYYPIATALSPIMDTHSFDCTHNKENDTISIETLASDYFKNLQKKQFTDHLILAGWSMGALIAHQMACLFALENKKPPLVLLDQPAISKAHKEGLSYKDRLFAYLHKVYIFTNQQFDKKIIESDAIDYERILNEFIRIQLTPEETTLESFKEFLDILVKHNEIVTQFSPTVYDGPVLLLKAKQHLLVDGNPIVQLEDLGWRKYCSNLTIIEVPGNHITMINIKNSKVVANVVEQWLKKIT